MLMKLRTNSSIGYLDVDALKSYDVENQEIIFESILYVKDREKCMYRGYVITYNDTVGITLEEYCLCDRITTKGRILLADNISKIFDMIDNQ